MESPIPPDPYNALGVSKTATGDEIRKAYRKLALRLHPDKCVDESLKAERTDEFHLVQQAYDIIGDEDKRLRYDAQIRLAELRRQNFELRNQTSRSTGGVPAYDVRTAAPRDDSYATRGTARAPYEEPRRQRYYEYDTAPRASAKKTSAYDEYLPPKRESPPRDRDAERMRAKAEQEADARRRKEKRREAEVRESRSTKYDVQDVYDEDARKADSRRPPMTRRDATRSDATRADATRDDDYASYSTATSPAQRKMEERERDAQRHIQERERLTRPSLYTRTSSSREAPLPYEVRRSAAPPKERVKESTRRSSPGKEERRRESVDQYERPTPNLKSHSSAPPVGEQPHQPHRAYTTQSDFDEQRLRKEPSPPPAFARATTMPTGNAIPPRRKDAAVPSSSSRLRHGEMIPPDSGYSSPAGTPYTANESHGYPAYADGKASTSPTRYKTVVAEPADARPSRTAAQMAGLDPKRFTGSSSSRKVVYNYGTETSATRPSASQSTSTREIPIVDPRRRSERGRDRELERDRDYRYSSDEKPREKLFGERGPGAPRYSQPTSFADEDIIYTKRYDLNDVNFGSGSRARDRRDESFAKPAFSRATTFAY